MTLDFAQSLVALDAEVIGAYVPVALVRCAGVDAASFLQGQVSQDLEPLAPGDDAETLLLSPQGKLDALVRVVRLAEDEFVLVAEVGVGKAALQRLRHFKIRVRADLTLETWSGLSLFSRPAAADRAGARATSIASELPGSIAFGLDWPNCAAASVLAPDGRLDHVAATVPIGDPQFLEYLRIVAGRPAAGRELDERTIAEEAGLVARAVSFTKGCYTGQELVERVDSRGANVARRLRFVRAESQGARSGDALVDGENVLGTLTSVAPAEGGGTVALGYFRRAVVPPTVVELTGADGPYAAEILELPA